MELFTQRPSDYLLLPDEQILGKLEGLSEQSLDQRRAALADYLESLGSEAASISPSATKAIPVGTCSTWPKTFPTWRPTWSRSGFTSRASWGWARR